MKYLWDGKVKHLILPEKEEVAALEVGAVNE